MHFDFVFSAAEILWTLTFAAELVLLVVLLGRDRSRRFPWFTANIAVMALLLLNSKLLFNRIPAVTAGTIFLVISSVAVVVGLLVVLEMARRAFKGAPRHDWIMGSVAALMLGITIVAVWGPWPAWSTFAGNSRIVIMRDLQMFADKGSILYALLDIELAVAILLFGRRFHAGWRSHPQMIAIGLSMAAMAELTVRIVWQLIATHTTVHSRAQYERLMALRERFYHAESVVLLCAIVWWIAWLWLDEPGTPPAAEDIEPGVHDSAAPARD